VADPDRERVLRLAEAVADRAHVDWDGEAARTGEPLRSRVRNLRLVHEIDQAHRETPEPALDQRSTEELPRAPSSWGPLRIVAPIDAGGFGQVYRARDEALNVDVALKLLHPVRTGEDPRDERFLGEARKLARVRHPNVLTVHGVAVHDGVVGLWTELLEGVTLERRIEREGPLGANEAALVGIELCRALSAVHQAGIVHRDVKTKNVMREKGGRIVLLDFSAGSDRHSSSESPVGTPLYMAPELFEGRDAGVSTDLYALGVLLYRLVTARFPVEARDGAELRRKHREGAVTKLLDVRADLPAGFVRTVERALERDPSRRYPSAGEMERDLAAFVGSVPGTAEPREPRFPLKTAGLAAAALTALAMLALWTYQATTNPLSVEAEWQRSRDGKAEVLQPGNVLAGGDCLRLNLQASRPTHVYVLNEDARGATAVLFPLSSLDLANPLPKGKRHVLPGTVAGRDECWRIGGGGGEESLLVIASLDPLRELEAEIARLPRVDGSAVAPIPEGEWGRRLRGVVGLSSEQEVGPRLADLARVLSGEIARKAGLWTWQVRFASGASGQTAAPASEPPQSELERQERALLDAPDDAVRMTALARTLLRAGDDPENLADHARALELAAHAFELTPDSIDACEARAVALERVFLRESALRAWERCLEIGGDAAFEERARARMRRLGEPRAEDGWKTAEPRLRTALGRGRFDQATEIARSFPEPVTALVEDELLGAWAEEFERDPAAKGARALAGIEALTRGVVEATGDRWLEAVVRPLHDSVAAGDGKRLATLAAAHRACAKARQARRAGRQSSAGELARRAIPLFANAGSPYGERAEYEVAVCDYHDGRLVEAQERFARSIDRVRGADHRALMGEIQWMQGLTASRQGRFGESRARYGEAVATFEGIRFGTRLAAVRNLLAVDDDRMGSYRLGWAHRHPVLEALERFDDPRKQHQVSLSAATAASMQELPRVAIEFGTAGLAIARARGDVVEIVEGSARLVSFLRQAGQDEAAKGVLADARSRLSAHPESGTQELDAVVDAAEAELLAETHPRAALADLDRAIAYYERGHEFRLARLYPLRGRVHWKLGNLGAAEADLVQGIARFESARDLTAGERSDIALGDVARRVYDEIISFEADARGSHEHALGYAERGRARLLRKHVDRAELPSPRTWPSLTPPSLAWVYYVLLDDRLLIWAGRNSGMQYVAKPIAARRITASIAQLVQMLEKGYTREETVERLAELHTLLIAPVAASLAGARTLIVLPDKALNLLPFAALVDPSTGRYLAQDYAIGISPSAAFLLSGADGATRQVAAGAEALDALVIGDPALSPSNRRYLGDLMGAEREARQVARAYEKGVLLVGAEATRARFLDEFGRHTVVHFAGHAVTNERDPLLSRLMFATDPQPDSEDYLLAREIAGLDPGSTLLVVLAACETSGRQVSAGEGPLGLARPFLGIGVPAVVATLWRIDDARSVELFVRFHRTLRGGMSPLTALNAAQRAMIEEERKDGGAIGAWATVQLFVGRYRRDGVQA
jgi:eukaryotic-like serine/threonine-protein kinase